MMANGLSEKDFVAFLVRTETFPYLQRKTSATWYALITQAFLTPPVVKVISCDYLSVHPGLGVMGGVECFRVFARPFDFLCIERLHQAVVGFP